VRSTKATGPVARLLAATVLVFHVVAWLHTAGAPHVTCPEHGEGRHLAVRAQVRPAGDVTRTRTTVVAASLSEGEQHDHCGLQHQGRSGFATPARALAAVVAEAPPAPPTALAVASKPVISFAPKTSPPQARS
jgi:hypothetical protein